MKEAKKTRGTLKAVAKGILLLGKYIFLFLIGMWATLAIYYSNLPWAWGRTSLAVAFALGTIVALLVLPKRSRTILCFLSAVLLVGIWWSLIPASNDRDWAPEVAVLPRATFDGNRVTVRNIRNFDYKTENDFTVRYYDKVFDLTKVKSVDFIVSHWDGLQAIAHTMLSFGFHGGDQLVLSVEIRREKGEQYETLKGFFKQYEIIYILGDERDIIRVRTNYRGEEVYLYPSVHPPEKVRALLLDVLRWINKLAERPNWYHTLGRNCTTSLVDRINEVSDNKIAFQEKVLLNGYSDELAYERGGISNDMPFEETKKAHFISDIAKKYNDDPLFSQKIRTHLRRKEGS
jgi:hypothetical protein